MLLRYGPVTIPNLLILRAEQRKKRTGGCGTIVHELGHEARDPDYAHGHVYVSRLANLAGKLPFLAPRSPSCSRETD